MYVRGKDVVIGRLVDYLLFELEYVCGYLWRGGPVCLVFCFVDVWYCILSVEGRLNQDNLP